MKHVHSKEPLTDVLTLTIIKTGGIKTISLYGGEDIAAYRKTIKELKFIT
jgi:hypothetical protein